MTTPSAHPASRRSARRGSGGPPGISAHRGKVSGAGPIADLAAFGRAARSGADLVEFDVRTTRDGALVALHDERLPDGRAVRSLTLAELCRATGVAVPEVRDVLERIAPHAIAHIDLKEAGIERRVAELALQVTGPDGFVVTSLEDASVGALKRDFPQLRVGLSLGRDVRGMPLRRAARVRASEVFPRRRLRLCGADFLAVAHPLARLRLLRFCARHGIDIWVWTVDRERAIHRFLRDPRVAVLVTNRASRTVAIKAQLSPTS